jgi:hypothetical protein
MHARLSDRDVAGRHHGTGDASGLRDAMLVVGGQALGGGSLGARKRVAIREIVVRVSPRCTAAEKDAPAVEITAEIDAVQVSMLPQFGMPQSSQAC